ncbi:nucleoside 2-deoxyribosyltransferase [Cytophagaceae bacterium ABcell3]|nr:nucleoside 2-deoxyribosyltransferase [Cytophagaceae bacterium ABcell3]
MKIYLAGPDVFRGNAKAHFERMKVACEAHGHEALIPLDNEVDMSKDRKIISASIFKGNINMMDKADVIIANIEPFRGACMDDGTAFEIGYCYAKGKKILAYTTCVDLDLPTITSRMFDMSKQPDYTEIEDFGSCVNLMISNAVEAIGGKIYTSFEECLNHLE